MFFIGWCDAKIVISLQSQFGVLAVKRVWFLTFWAFNFDCCYSEKRSGVKYGRAVTAVGVRARDLTAKTRRQRAKTALVKKPGKNKRLAWSIFFIKHLFSSNSIQINYYRIAAILCFRKSFEIFNLKSVVSALIL